MTSRRVSRDQQGTFLPRKREAPESLPPALRDQRTRSAAQALARLRNEVDLVEVVLARKKRAPSEELTCGPPQHRRTAQRPPHQTSGKGRAVALSAPRERSSRCMAERTRCSPASCGSGGRWCGWALSLSPDFSGRTDNSLRGFAPKMHPTLHMSIAPVYSAQESSSSGARYHLRRSEGRRAEGAVRGRAPLFRHSSHIIRRRAL